MDPDIYYVWVGGSCDYAHEERAGAGSYIIDYKSANADLIRQILSEIRRHVSVSVKLVPYHKYSRMEETHEMSHRAMIGLRFA